MKRLVLTIAILIGLAAPAWAGFAEGFAAYERGDYATALREFRPLAEQGDAVAQYNLGIMYSKGQGVAQDYAEAVKWYRKAADQGNADAQNNLGHMYSKGRGVSQDDAEAVKWYRKAAKQIAQGIREHGLRIFVWDRQQGFDWIRNTHAGDDIVSGLVGNENREMIEVFPRTQEETESYRSIYTTFFEATAAR